MRRGDNAGNIQLPTLNTERSTFQERNWPQIVEETT